MFTVSLANAGTTSVADIPVAISLPGGVELLAVTIDGDGAFNRDTELWQVLQLPPTSPEATAILTLEVRVREAIIPPGEDFYTLRAEASVVDSIEDVKTGAQIVVLRAGCVDLELQLLSQHTDGDEECGMGCLTAWFTSLHFRVTNNGPPTTDDAIMRLLASISGDLDDPVAWLNGEEVRVFGAELVRPLGQLGRGESYDLTLELLYFTAADERARVSWRASVETDQLKDPVVNDTLGGSESHASSSGGCFLNTLGVGTRTLHPR